MLEHTLESSSRKREIFHPMFILIASVIYAGLSDLDRVNPTHKTKLLNQKTLQVLDLVRTRLRTYFKKLPKLCWIVNKIRSLTFANLGADERAKANPEPSFDHYP